MAVVEKGILITAGVVFAGLVGYKVIKKKKPELIDKAKASVQGAQKQAGKVFDSARDAFRDGYASA